MIVAGCDIGSRTGKVVLMHGGQVLGWSIVPRRVDCAETAQEAMARVLAQVGLDMGDLSYIVGTGYGKARIPFAQEVATEIACQSAGAAWIEPAVRTVIDMGGQDCKVLRTDGRGMVSDFVMNDKCASGTGRFLEDIARVLEVDLEEMGPLSLESTEEVSISAQCSVFAKSEVVSLIAERVAVRDILAGIHEAVVRRLVTLVHRLGLEERVLLSGGVAKNAGLVGRVRERLKVELVSPAVDPQVIGALGAALIAQRAVGASAT
jgi:predicted CoA-substrate-specific enzyme activase